MSGLLGLLELVDVTMDLESCHTHSGVIRVIRVIKVTTNKSIRVTMVIRVTKVTRVLNAIVYQKGG